MINIKPLEIIEAIEAMEAHSHTFNCAACDKELRIFFATHNMAQLTAAEIYCKYCAVTSFIDLTDFYK